MTKRQVVRLARALWLLRPRDVFCEATYVRLVRTVGEHAVPFVWADAWNAELPRQLHIGEAALQARADRLEELKAKN
jgi:hypothetical protein